MPGLKIRIAPAEAIQPETASRPIEDSQRWDSPYDNRALQPNVSVFMTRPAYIRVCVHACSAEVEVGGALIGQLCLDEETGQQFIVVQHMLPARHTRQGSVYLTFTQDTIVQFHEELETNHSGKRIVGWYHTHPRMGIFLSHYDTWLHNNFFPEPWQVALVVEPHTSLGGFFVRQRAGLLDPSRYFGFYELDGSFGRSMVTWKNLSQFEERQKEGDAPHE